MSRNRCVVLVLVTALAASLDAGKSFAQAGHDGSASASAQIAFTLGDLGRVVSYGSDGTWVHKATEDGSLVISSLVDNPGWETIKNAAPVLPYSLDIRVRPEIALIEGHAVGAGVAFGFENGTKAKAPSYYVAYFAGDTLFVASHDETGFNILWQSVGVGTADDGFAKIHIDVKDREFDVSASGANTVSFGDHADWSLAGPYGLFISGNGRATFRDLALNGQMPAAPPPAAAPLSPTRPTLTVTPPPLPSATPVPPPLPQAVYFYDDGGKPAGPLTLAELKAKFAGGVIGPTTLVWKSNTKDWVAAKDLPDLSP